MFDFSQRDEVHYNPLKKPAQSKSKFSFNPKIIFEGGYKTGTGCVHNFTARGFKKIR